ncbi:hypothetical protein NDU88_000853 [Pleurodeles waltl]|uniref:Uncharacterized protein n=1 Tax=Pleurodeles waltl TaxID=8319 RepID=A0AAV7N9B7_PLEWA|nr:hypothetical protein NDU88_000853 [Pleurodeles waltl]
MRSRISKHERRAGGAISMLETSPRGHYSNESRAAGLRGQGPGRPPRRGGSQGRARRRPPWSCPDHETARWGPGVPAGPSAPRALTSSRGGGEALGAEGARGMEADPGGPRYRETLRPGPSARPSRHTGPLRQGASTIRLI